MSQESPQEIGIKRSFDDRIVRYEQIHKVQEADYAALVHAVDPQSGEVIFEGCAGYADVTKHIIEASRDFDVPPAMYILDDSPVQMQRAQNELQLLPNVRFMLGDIRKTAMPDSFCDKTVIKMGIHELPKVEQLKIFSEMHRILKLSGKFVIWELALGTDTQKAFQDIIRKKDELAGFESLVRNRYFQRHEELQVMFDMAGFKEIKDEYHIRYTFNPRGRLDELVSKERRQLQNIQEGVSVADEAELHSLGEERVAALLGYIRDVAATLPEEVLKKIGYKDLGNDVEITFDKVIMSGIKA